MPERWKTVHGHDTYEVSDLGNVRSLVYQMRPPGRCCGYPRVVLRVAGGYRWSHLAISSLRRS
jgi:hypothetical protein